MPLLSHALAAALFAVPNASAPDPGYRWTAFAGQPPQHGLVDGAGPSARFYFPEGLCGDVAGNVYIADTWNNAVREVRPDGTTLTRVGASTRAGSTDGPVSVARLYGPTGVALARGSLFIVDRLNHTIRQLTASGVVSTYAGKAGEPGSADGPVATARFNYPFGITTDSGGNLFITDRGNNTIRKIDTDGNVTTIAGAVGFTGAGDGVGPEAHFNSPGGIAAGAGGMLFLTDTGNHTVRRIAADGTVTTVAGAARIAGAVNGTGWNARFRSPEGIVAFADGSLLVADSGNSCVRVVSPAGEVGLYSGRLNVAGYADGSLTTARYFAPLAIAATADGGFAVADTDNHSIRKIAGTGDSVSTWAGPGGNFGHVDGAGAGARFSAPSGLAVHSSGDVYVADSKGNTIRRISPDGVVTRVAGNGTNDYVDGATDVASVNYPMGVAVTPDRHVYFCEYQMHTIRVLNPDGSIATVAGNEGLAGSADDTGSAARFNFPTSIARDADGNLYIADNDNHTIRRIAAGTTTVTTFAGKAGVSGSADGVGGVARFSFPRGLSVDAAGNVFVTDSGNNTIRRISRAGEVTTIAGRAGVAGTTDGDVAVAQFSFPTGIAVDAGGRIFVGDDGNHTIRLIDGSNVTTIGGYAGSFDWRDGLGTDAMFFWPDGIAIDANGSLYVSDTGNNLVEKGTPRPAIVASPQPVTAPAGTAVTLTVSAVGPGLTFQWKLNGTAIPGATSATYTISAVQSATAGSYTVEVTNAAGTVVSDTAVVSIGPAANPARISNLAIRSTAGSGAEMLIVGVTIGGAGTSGAKPLLIRGIGPALSNFGVAGALADPTLTLFSGTTRVAANDNWGGDANVASVGARVGAFALGDPRSLDAALYAPALVAGGYSIQIAGAGDAAGVALAEIYDATPDGAFTAATPRLTNVSARTQIAADSGLLIAGFTIAGSGSKRVLIRAIGPSLGQFGVDGTVADPRLEVYQGNTRIATNDNWSGEDVGTASASVGAFALVAGAKDAALVLSVSAGGYTAQVSGAGGGTTLVEIYEVP